MRNVKWNKLRSLLSENHNKILNTIVNLLVHENSLRAIDFIAIKIWQLGDYIKNDTI